MVFEGEFGAYLELCGLSRRVWCLFGVVWSLKESLVPIWSCVVFEGEFGAYLELLGVL